jgi:hypothetical protein
MPYSRDRDQFPSSMPTPQSQARRKHPITPSASDLDPYAKAIVIHVTGGGRASLTYIPTDNDDAQTVTVEVADGWVSDTSVRRVSALSVMGAGTATVWGLYN